MDGYYFTYWANIDPTWDYKTRTLYYELVNRANAMGDRVMFGRQLKRGQLVISLRELERETGISNPVLYRIIRKLQDFGSLKVEQIKTYQKPTTIVNLITICNRSTERSTERSTKIEPQSIDNTKVNPISIKPTEASSEAPSEAHTLINNTNNIGGGVTRAREDERQGDESEQKQIAEELIHVLETDSQSSYQVGIRNCTMETARALAMDFASQCLMNNDPREHGRRLVQHFCYWFDKRTEREQKQQANAKRIQDNRTSTAENIRRTTTVCNAIINGQLTLEQAFAIADAQCSLSSPPQSIPIDEGLRSTLSPPKLPEMVS